MVNLHASLIVDMLLYNFEWLYNVLKTGIYEERYVESNEVNRYTFESKDIEKLYLWTTDSKHSQSKVQKIKKLGFRNIELINQINFYEEIFSPEIDKDSKILERFIRNGKKQEMSISYGPIFINYYTDINWHKGQFTYIWNRIKNVSSNRVYIDFQINRNYLSSRRLSGQALTKEEKNDFIEYAQSVVGDNVAIIEKPDFYNLDSKKDFDIGIRNFCFSRSFLNIGIDNMYEQRSRESMHFPSSNSLILRERPGEGINQRQMINGRFEDDIKMEERKKINNEKIVSNVESFFNFL